MVHPDALAAGAALRRGIQRLSAPDSLASADSPALDAELLLAHVLALSRTALRTHPERPLSGGEREAYADALRRRSAGEPVAYITGHREFMGLDFQVDRRVLVPRPETELLVECALEAIPGDGAGTLAADIGTGSGAIAVSLAHYRPALRVYAIDTSEAALAVAQTNARCLLGSESERVSLLHGRGAGDLPEPVHLLAANLPYIPTADVQRLAPTVRQYEPHLALDGGADGLDAYRELLAQLPPTLLPGACVLLECDPAQAAILAEMAATALPGAVASVRQDLLGCDRLVRVAL